MRNLLGFLFCFVSLMSWSQTITYDTIIEVKEVDTGIFDTIYYVQKHIQISEEYVVVDTVRGNQWAVDIYGGASVWSSDVRYSEADLTLNSSKTSGYYFGGSIYYNFPKKWSLRVGAKLDHQKTKANYTKTTNYLQDVYEEVNDTLDTYHTVDGSVITYIHVIETKIEKRTEERTAYSDVSYNWQMYFLKIPAQVSYKAELNRWSFHALAGTSLNFQLQQMKSNSEKGKETLVSFHPSGIISLQTGYYLGNSTNIYIEPIFEKSFIKDHNSVFPSNQFSIGFGLIQFF